MRGKTFIVLPRISHLVSSRKNKNGSLKYVSKKLLSSNLRY